MSEKKRILIDGMTGNTGGMETFIMNLVRNMDKTRWAFEFVVTDQPVAYENELETIGDIHRITPRSQSPKKNKKEIQELFRRKKYDGLWFNKTTLSNIEMLKAAKKYKIPVRICHSHAAANLGSSLTLLLHKLNRKKAIRLSTCLAACSDAAADWFYGKDKNKATIVKNAVALEKYTYTPEKANRIKEELGLNDLFTVGHVGRLSAIKNQTFLLEIFAEIHKKEPRSVLLLCGDGEEKETLQKKAGELGIAEEVRFLGIRNDICDMLSAMDLMIFPSLHEGAPFALIEAQAAGLFCLVSDTVRTDAVIPELIHYQSLKEPAEIWAEKALSFRGKERITVAEKLRQSEYSLDFLLKKAETMLTQERNNT